MQLPLFSYIECLSQDRWKLVNLFLKRVEVFVNGNVNGIEWRSKAYERKQ